MSFRGREIPESTSKMDMGGPRRFPGGNMDDKPLDEQDDRRFDAGRGRRPPFGRGRRMSPPGRMERQREFGGSYGREEPPPMRDRSPVRGQEDRFSDRFKKEDGPFPKREDLGRKDTGRPFYGDEPPPRERFNEGRSRFDGPGGFNSRYDGPNDSYKPRPMGYASGNPPPKGYGSEGFPKPNECEIIAVSKNLRNYAESVEDRIKNIGILVDVLFLKDEALLTQTIDDIARRGCLYAMVISSQNETHGSVTVNILHGTPQEHRNMPLEDALKLVTRNFHEHIRAQRENMERERAERGQYVGGVSADREIQFLLRMLADGRWVSVAEIAEVIRYLSERRDKMKASPGGDRMLGKRPVLPSSDSNLDVPPFKSKDPIDVLKKEQELENRIMNIMNQGATSSAGNTPSLSASLPSVNLPPPRSVPGVNAGLNNTHSSGIPGLKSTLPDEEGLGMEKSGSRADAPFSSATAVPNPPSNSGTSSTYINFNNDKVQKALDSLMQSGSSLLKNISMTSPSNNLAPKPTTSIPGLGSSSDSIGMQHGNLGSRGTGDIMPVRGSGNMDMGPRGTGGNMGDLGPQRGSGNVSDMGGPQRGPGDMGGPGAQRGGSDMGGMGPPPRGGYGGMGDMRGSNTGGSRGFNNDSGPRKPEMGRMSAPPGISNFPGPNQYGKYQGGGPGQQGNFGGPYNNPSNMGMPRYGRGMGGPQRY